MIKVLLYLIFVLCSTVALNLKEDWTQWKAKFNRSYTQSGEKEFVRFAIFARNRRLVLEHNHEYALGLHTYRLSLNAFADLSSEEFQNKMLNWKKRQPTKKQPRSKESSLGCLSQSSAPDSIDWRQKGAVTLPWNQGKACAASYAFAATAAIEGRYWIKTNQLVRLSVQNLIDCSQPEGNDGCVSGTVDSSFQYVKDERGINTDEDYPYVGSQQQVCSFNKSSAIARVAYFIDVPVSEDDLKLSVAKKGPTAVNVDASSKFFQFYESGVYTDNSCSKVNLNHPMAVVGYGTDNGQDYWIVKNSWSEVWGEAGYIRMARNRQNMCGIASQAAYCLL